MGIAFLFVIGLCAGSFVNALVWRLHEGRDFVKARSQCPNCHHQLALFDLVPILSWIALRAHCRYCHKKISVQYPLVEIICGLVFVLSYYFWPAELSAGQLILFITWLAVSVGLLALAVYDLRWMLLPNKILYPTFLVAITGKLTYILFFSNDITHSSWLLALSVLVSSGIFYLLYEISHGRWIGFGDVRLGFITGTILASPSSSLLMIFTASVIGTIAFIPALFAKRRTLKDRLPYGPFLIISTALVLLFGQDFFNWYNHVFLIR